MLLASPWRPHLADGSGSTCERLVDALALDIGDGTLPPGARLPAHRALAWALGIGLGTVTKGYGLLERRGLVRSVRGRGTFVVGVPQMAAGMVDLAVNMPPQALGDRLLAASLNDLARRLDADSFGAYAAPGGRLDHRVVLARWLSAGGVPADAERLMICNGAQHALTIALGITCDADAELLTEAVTYPGAIAFARRRRLRLTGLPLDAEGIVPDGLDLALQRAAAAGRRGVLYVTPTLHNPTTATMGRRRREEIARLCRAYDATIVEDDVHSSFAEPGTAPLAALAPERTLHVCGLSKVLSPGLRIGSLLVPQRWAAAAFAELAATCTMAPLLSCLIMERWLTDGTAASVIRSIRDEAARRVALARAALPQIALRAGPGFHVWLPMAPDEAKALPARAAALGVLLPAPEAFMVDPDAAECGLRLSLGGPAPEALRAALASLPPLLLGGERGSWGRAAV